MRPRFVTEFLRPLGEEHVCAAKLNLAGDARDRCSKPLRPIHIEEDTTRAPYDEGWNLQPFQAKSPPAKPEVI